jgi:hypothetical protein
MSDPSYLSKVLSGYTVSSPYPAARLDEALGAGGTIRAGGLALVQLVGRAVAREEGQDFVDGRVPG